MKFGMTDPQFEILQTLVLNPLKSRGAKVFLFGSRATGKHHPHSDVDLLYVQVACEAAYQHALLPSGDLRLPR